MTPGTMVHTPFGDGRLCGFTAAGLAVVAIVGGSLHVHPDLLVEVIA